MISNEIFLKNFYLNFKLKRFLLNFIYLSILVFIYFSWIIP